MKMHWEGKRVLIIGAARQGLALARFLAARGAQVTLNDKSTEAQMQNAIASLAGLPVQWSLGAHPLELLDTADLVAVSGGVPLTLPIIVEANRRGLPLTNDSQIFMDAVQAPVIGITGSAGKTTTTTLVGRMAEHYAQATGRRAWIGGNIGLPLVEYVDEIQPDDIVVVEFSSFQLEQMTTSPRIAAVLNITPNHLDRHGTLEAYAAAKARIVEFQRAGDAAILNREDPGSWNLRGMVRGRLVSFGLGKPEAEGTYLDGDRLMVCGEQGEVELMPRSLIALRGEHNLRNVLAACAVAWAAGIPVESMQAGVRGFSGVPHRLELVREWNGVRWYNNSIDTAPERTMAAIQSFDEPLVVLLGGRDKNLPWEKLAELLHQRVEHVVVFGEAAPKILQAIGPLRPDARLKTVDQQPGLQAAVSAAANIVEDGDVVLLSPGGTSFDEFKDFEERGERFREWVKALS